MHEKPHEIQGTDLEGKEDQFDMPIEVDKANEALRMEVLFFLGHIILAVSPLLISILPEIQVDCCTCVFHLQYACIFYLEWNSL